MIKCATQPSYTVVESRKCEIIRMGKLCGIRAGQVPSENNNTLLAEQGVYASLLLSCQNARTALTLNVAALFTCETVTPPGVMFTQRASFMSTSVDDQ